MPKLTARALAALAEDGNPLADLCTNQRRDIRVLADKLAAAERALRNMALDNDRLRRENARLKSGSKYAKA